MRDEKRRDAIRKKGEGGGREKCMRRLLRRTHTQKRTTKPHPIEYTPPNYDTPFPEHLVVF